MSRRVPEVMLVLLVGACSSRHLGESVDAGADSSGSADVGTADSAGPDVADVFDVSAADAGRDTAVDASGVDADESDAFDASGGDVADASGGDVADASGADTGDASGVDAADANGADGHVGNGDACQEIVGKTFVSVASLECGMGASGFVYCHWMISFGATTYYWRYSDTFLSNTYSCSGSATSAELRTGTSLGGSYDVATRQLLWQGAIYTTSP